MAGKDDADDDTNDDVTQNHDAGDTGDGAGPGAGDHEDDDEDEAATEAQARRIGWVPESEWKGGKKPKHGFMSATEYLKRGEQVIPVVLDRNRKLNDALDKTERINRDVTSKLDAATTALAETNKRLEEMGGVVKTLHNQNVEIGKRAYDKARADLLAERRKAVADADPDKVDAIQGQIDELDKTKPTAAVIPPAADDDDDEDRDTRRDTTRRPPANEKTPTVSEVAKSWVEKNPWFNKSPMLNGAAIELHDENLKSGMTEAESFETLTDKVKEQFPDKFENPARRGAPSVARPGGTPPPRKNKKTFEDLPADAKTAYAAISRGDAKYTKEMYLADYQWD